MFGEGCHNLEIWAWEPRGRQGYKERQLENDVLERGARILKNLGLGASRPEGRHGYKERQLEKYVFFVGGRILKSWPGGLEAKRSPRSCRTSIRKLCFGCGVAASIIMLLCQVF